MPTLLDLPNEVLVDIIRKSGVRPILTLRKVCHDFRNLIDDTTPLQNLQIQISVCFNEISISLSSGWDIQNIQYLPQKTGCIVVHKQRKPPPPTCDMKSLPVPIKGPIIRGRLPIYPSPLDTKISELDRKQFLKRTDFVEICLDDLDVILKVAKMKVREFSIQLFYTQPENDKYLEPVVDRFLDNLGNKYQSCPLQVHHFTNIVRKADQLLKILKCIVPRKASVFCVPHFTIKVDAKELTCLKYWKELEFLSLKNVIITRGDIREFLHFENAVVSFETVTCEDMKVLKEKFFRSTVIKSFDVQYEKFIDGHRMANVFGTPVRDGEWSLPIPETQKVLKISLAPVHHQTVRFLRM